MPVEIVTGDMFKSKAEAWCNPVNCLGVMGAGVAKEFAERFPKRCENYRDACASGMMRPGKVLVHSDGRRNPPVIFHIATKDDWRDPSKIEWIADGVERLAMTAKSLGIKSIAMPALGCGRGGLPWDHVRRIIEETFDRLAPSITVELYIPKGMPKKADGRQTKKPSSRQRSRKVV